MGDDLGKCMRVKIAEAKAEIAANWKDDIAAGYLKWLAGVEEKIKNDEMKNETIWKKYNEIMKICQDTIDGDEEPYVRKLVKKL